MKRDLSLKLVSVLQFLTYLHDTFLFENLENSWEVVNLWMNLLKMNMMTQVYDTMKRYILSLMAIAVAVGVMTGCEEIDGKQTPIKLDKSELTFPSAGGEQTVTAVNYRSWWISGAYEDKKYVDGVVEYVNYVYPTSTDGQEYHTCDILDGGWYYVVVPDKGESNRAVITVSENNTSNPRSATIITPNPNAFTDISIQPE